MTRRTTRSASIPLMLRSACVFVHGLIAVIALAAPAASAQGAAVESLVGPGAEGRLRAPPAPVSLDGEWTLYLDPGAVGLDDDWAQPLSAGEVPPTAPSESLSIAVPGPLENTPVTRRYDGVVWYVHTFDDALLRPGRVGSLGAGQVRWRLRFEMVNYACRVWLDGTEVGEHEGGYDAFELDVSDAVKSGPRHTLVVRVLDPGAIATDGLTLATTPHAKESWYENFGGILGSVTLSVLTEPVSEITGIVADAVSGEVHVDARVVAPPIPAGRVLDVELHVHRLPLLEADVPLSGATSAVDVARASSRVVVRKGDGETTFSASVSDPELWSPQAPHRYRATLVVDGVPSAPKNFGFRTVELDTDGFRLNGERVLLKGVLYQPHDTGLSGRVPDDAALVREVERMLDAGFNFVRAHVRPAPPAFLDACDRLGLMVLEEPAIGWVQDAEGLEARLQREIDWMVSRDHHHPSIVIWGVLNELSGKAFLYGGNLSLRLASLDRTRPVIEDSGGFVGGGRYIPVGGRSLLPMHDDHFYPPFPMPISERERLRTTDRPDGPMFASEYGYGTQVDASRALAGFDSRGIEGPERRIYATMVNQRNDAIDSGESWRAVGWLEPAQQLHAEAAADLTEALRANPGLDMLCYTQWRAVSYESSAGLIEPWGEERPAYAALSHALRPLMVAVFPSRASVRQGETHPVDVVVVNDTGAPVLGELVVGGDGVFVADSESGVQSFPVGVTVRAVDMLFTGEGSVFGEQMAQVTARLEHSGEVLDESRPATVPILATAETIASFEFPPGLINVNVPVVDRSEEDPWAELPSRRGVAVKLLAPADDDGVVRAFAERRHLGFTDSEAELDPWDTLIVLDHPETLGERLTLDERMELWAHVWAGSSAMVLLSDPGEDAVSEMLGKKRGVRALMHVPVRSGVSAAPGNFMGRVHALLLAWPERREADDLGLLNVAFAAEADGLPRLSPRRVAHRVPYARPATPEVRLLTGADRSLSPTAMLVGELPSGSRPAMITVGHFDRRNGAPVAAVPFGDGMIVFVGLPLLDPVGDAVDPRRDAFLAQLVMETMAETVQRHLERQRAGDPVARGEWEPFSAFEAETLGYGQELLAKVIALGERHSALTGGRIQQSGFPESVAAALNGQVDAMEAFLDGRRGEARHIFIDALNAVWNEQTAGFLAFESEILRVLQDLLDSDDHDDLALGYELLELWFRAVIFWFADDRETAFSWLGTTELRMAEVGLVPWPEPDGSRD